MTVALKLGTNGQLAAFTTSDTLSIDDIDRLSGSGNMTIGGSLGAAEELQLASVSGVVRVLGDLALDGAMDTDLDLGTNDILGVTTLTFSGSSATSGDINLPDGGSIFSYGGALERRLFEVVGSAVFLGENGAGGAPGPIEAFDIEAANNVDFSIGAADDVILSIQSGFLQILEAGGTPSVLRFYDGDTSNFVGFRGATSIGANVTWILPATDSTGTQYLRSDGAGNLSWGSPAGSGDVVGPAGGHGDNVLPRWDGIDSNVLQNTGITIGDSDDISGVYSMQLDLLVSLPSHSEGLIFYDDNEHTLAVYNDQTAVTHQLGQEVHLRVYNNTGSQIDNGEVVYVSGAASGRPTVGLAQADASSTAFAIGVATHDIPNASEGIITAFGLVTMDTSTFSAGDTVYVSPTTPGALTATAPSGGDVRVEVGTVATSGVSGRLFVDTHGLPLNGNKSLNVPGDLSVSTNGSTISPVAPRIIGFVDLSTGEAGRFQFGDAANGLQNGFDQCTQLYSYHTLQLLGDRQTGTAPVFVSGVAEDIAVLVDNIVSGDVALVVRAHSTQTANLMEWQSDGGTALVAIAGGGTLNLINHDLDNIKTATFNAEYAYAGGATLDWNNGQKQGRTLTANTTITAFTNPPGPCNLILRITQAAAGGPYTIAFPAAVKWPGGTDPTMTTTASATDIFAFYFDGTTYYGVASQNFS